MRASGQSEKSGVDQDSNSKILRIALIQEGNILEERWFKQGKTISIGQATHNDLVVPTSKLPNHFTMFSFRKGQYTLCFQPGWEGQVTLDDQLHSLAEVSEQGLAQQKGDQLRLPLSALSRGKLRLGEFTLIFQLVIQPPIPPQPQLPPSVRGGFFQNLDYVLLWSLVILGVLHFGFLLYLRTMDFPRRMEADMIPDNFARYIPTVEKPKAIDLKKIVKLGEKAVKKAKKAGPRRSSSKARTKTCDAECQRVRREARRARLAEQVAKLGVVKLLGTRGKGSGVTRNLLASGDPGTDAAEAFKGMGGLTVAGHRGGGLAGQGGNTAGQRVGIGELGGRVGGPTRVGSGTMVREKTPKAIVKQRPAQIDGQIKSSDVARVIRRGMAFVRACYQRALRRSPQLGGKIVIRLMINAVGKVTSTEIDSDTIGDSSVAACIRAHAARWRFSPPEGGTAEVAVPFVFQSSK